MRRQVAVNQQKSKILILLNLCPSRVSTKMTVAPGYAANQVLKNAHFLYKKFNLLFFLSK
jgi:hypothetical protein